MTGRLVKAILAGAICGPLYTLAPVLAWLTEPYEIEATLPEISRRVMLIGISSYIISLMLLSIILILLHGIIKSILKKVDAKSRTHHLILGAVAGLSGSFILYVTWSIVGESSFVWTMIAKSLAIDFHGIKIGTVLAMILFVYQAIADMFLSSDGPWITIWLFLSGMLGGIVAALVWWHSTPNRSRRSGRAKGEP